MKASFSAILVLSLGLCCPCQAFLDDDVIPSDHPDKYLVEFYRTNAGQVKELRTSIRNKDTSVDQRLLAFKELNKRFPEAAVQTASEMVRDSAEPIAAYAVNLLSSSVVMSNHPMMGTHRPDMDSGARYIIQKHEKAKTSLREAVLDTRRAISLKAIRCLANLSDEKALDALVEANKKGIYSDAEAAGIMGLASSNVSKKHLDTYLSSGSMEAKKTAVGVLAGYADQREWVQTNYLFNDKAELALRIAASQVITNKPDSIVPLLADPSKLPPELYLSSVDAYVKAKGRKLSTSERKQLIESTNKIAEKNPNLIIPKSLRDG